MATTALGIMQTSDGAGVDPLTHRRIIKSHWANAGIVSGLNVTGGSGLTYNVSAGNAVLSRSDSDGYTEAYWEGGTTGAVSTGDPSNPRIDTVWLKAYDAQQGDPDNRVHVGVTQGTPSSSPVAPSAPSGCLAIARMRMPAGATSTSSAQQTTARDYAIPFGASLGRLGYYHDTSNGTFDTTRFQRATRCAVQINIPTDRLLDLRFTASVACSGSGDQHTSWYVAFMVDGVEVEYSGGEFWLNTETCETVQKNFTVEVEAGTHTIAVVTGWVSGEVAPLVRSGSYTIQGGTSAQGNFTGTFPGKIFEVWDRGVAQ